MTPLPSDSQIRAAIRKTVGRMLALMLGTELPLLRYSSPTGKYTFYTIEPLGPDPKYLKIGLVDWQSSSPVWFGPRFVAQAHEAGFVDELPDGSVALTELGLRAAQLCWHTYAPVIYDHFRNRGIDWRKLR